MKVSRILALALACIALGAPLWAAQPKVQVLAVEVFNAPNVKEIAPGLRSIIASRIAGEGYQVRTRDDLPDQPDFSLRTTITRLGGVYSVDAELSPAQPGVEGVRGYETVTEFDDLMKAIEKVCDRVRMRMAQLAGAKVPPEPIPSPPLERHPPPQVLAPPPPVAPVAARTPSDALQSYREVAKIEGEASTITSCDLDGDGAVELAVAVGRNLLIYRETPQALEKVWEGASEVGFKPLLLTCGELEGDSRAELVLTGASGAEGYTQLYHWSAKGLEKLGGTAYAVLKAVPDRDGRSMLAGMTSVGGANALSGEPRRFILAGGKATPAEKLALPDNVPTLDFQWFDFRTGTPVLLLLDKQSLLRIYSEKFSMEAVTEDPVMGSRSRVEGERDQRTGEVAASWDLNSPAISWVAADGRTYALMPVNNRSSYTPGVWKSYENGGLTAVRWDGVALHKGGESPKFPGYIAGIARGRVDEAGRGKAYALLLKIEGMVFREYSARLIAFEL